MKKNIILVIISVILLTFVSVGCTSGKKDESLDEYKMIYSDGEKVHTINVKQGDLFSISNLPKKNGYTFTGLYDAEIGGTQYVNATGVAVSPFSDRRNITLYPQFVAKQYTLKLNYNGATGSVLSMTATYGERIPSLPGNLMLPDMNYINFTGWYTQLTYGNEIQLSDSNGLSLIEFDKQLSDKCDSEGVLAIYAKFEKQKYDVTFYSFDGQKILSTMKIEHGNKISEVANNISENGAYVNFWTTVKNSEIDIFDGDVISDMTLYAISFEKKVSLARVGCEINNGYNPATPQSVQRTKTHQDYELLELFVEGCALDRDGNYIMATNRIVLSLRLLQDITRLPKNAVLGYTMGLPWDWQQNRIYNDNYSGEVYQTNINGQNIGLGAYYVRITYSDGTATETNAVNFMNGMEKGDIKRLNIENVQGKKITQIDIITVYEIYYYVYNGGWFGDYSNWRCTATLKFA